MRALPSVTSLVAVLSLVGCGSSNGSAAAAPDSGTGTGVVPTPSVADECPVVVSESSCDTTQRPIVFVHGTYDSGDAITNVALLFGSNGYCSDRFIAIDYDSLVAVANLSINSANNATPVIDAAIDAVLQANPSFTQVDLIGHSQGAAQCYAYLNDATHAAKVAHYVQLAGGAQAAPPGPPDAGVATLSVSSNADTVEGPGSVAGAQQTIVFETQDHEGVAGSTDTFVAIWQYLHQGQYPQYTTIQCGDPMVTLSAKTETLGDNGPPQPGSFAEIFEVGSDPSDSGAPVQTFMFAADGGSTSTWQAKRLQQYEFRGIAADGGVIGHEYFTPFRRDNRWVRFVLPSQDPLAQFATNPVTTLKDNAETSFVARVSKGSFRADLGDSLTVNGIEALNLQDATKATVTVALFIYDANKDGKSEGGSISSSFLPYFVRGTDMFIASSPPAFVNVTFNGKTILIPNWPSVSQGLTAFTFE